MLDAGAFLSFGSDWPVVPFDPIATMKVAISQGLSAQEALVASTTHAALSLHEPNAGHLLAGAFGDCVVLDENPLDIDWETTLPTVRATIFAGKIVYSKELMNVK